MSAAISVIWTVPADKRAAATADLVDLLAKTADALQRALQAEPVPTHSQVLTAQLQAALRAQHQKSGD